MTEPMTTDEVCAYLYDLGSTPFDHKVARMIRSLAADNAALRAQVEALTAERDRLKDRVEALHLLVDGKIALILQQRARAEAAEAQVAAHEAVIKAARQRALEEAAALVRGEPYHGIYRQWRWWGTGNRSNEDEITQFADAAAAAFSRLAEAGGGTGEEQP